MTTRWKISIGNVDAKDPAGAPLTGFTPATQLSVSTPDSDSVATVVLVLDPGADKLYSVNTVNFGRDVTPVPGGDITFSFRLNDDVDYRAPVTPQDWLSNVDPRGPIVNHAAGAVPTFSVAKIIGSSGSIQFDVDSQILYNEASPGRQNDRVVLFDIPRQELLGISELRSLAFLPPNATSNSRAYRIGSPGSGGANAIFDEYFVSSVPRDNSVSWSPLSGAPLANTAMTVYDPAAGGTTAANLWTALQSPNSAEYLLVRDTLNVNSTSLTAWRSMLAGALLVPYEGTKFSASSDSPVWQNVSKELEWRWGYSDGTNASTENIKNSFFRFPHTATNVNGLLNTLSIDLNGSDTGDRDAASFKLGLRQLTRGQIEELAWNVVALLKDNTFAAPLPRPFYDVSEFVESGLLQRAIDEVGLNNLGWPAGANAQINKPNQSLQVHRPICLRATSLV
jgi:hypothetical protein